MTRKGHKITTERYKTTIKRNKMTTNCHTQKDYITTKQRKRPHTDRISRKKHKMTTEIYKTTKETQNYYKDSK